MFDGSHLRVYEFALALVQLKGTGRRSGREVILKTTLVICEGQDGGLDKVSLLATYSLFSLHFTSPAPYGFAQFSSLGTCLNSYLSDLTTDEETLCLAF